MYWIVLLYGTLNVIGPHNLIGYGTIRRCGFVGVGMALLEEVCHCGCGLEDSYTQDPAHYVIRLSVACKTEDSQLFLQHHVCLRATMFPTMIMDWNSKVVSKTPQLYVFIIRDVIVTVSFHSKRRPLSKTEDGIEDWVIAMIGLIMFLFGVTWILVCGLENRMNVLSASSWAIPVGA